MATGIKVNGKNYSQDLSFGEKRKADARVKNLRAKGTNAVVRRTISKRSPGFTYTTYRRKRKKRA